MEKFKRQGRPRTEEAIRYNLINQCNRGDQIIFPFNNDLRVKNVEKFSNTGRTRRDKLQFWEKCAMADLCANLPLSRPIRAHLDKSGVIRIAIAHFQLRRVLGELQKYWREKYSWNFCSALSYMSMRDVANNYRLADYLHKIVAVNLADAKFPAFPIQPSEPIQRFAFNAFQTMNGFILILDYNGKIVYVSETAAVHLGLSQVDLIGKCLNEMLYEPDLGTAYLTLAIGIDTSWITVVKAEIAFSLRFKCALVKRSSGVNLPGYKSVHFTGKMLESNDCRFIGYGQPLVEYGVGEIRLGTSMFMFRTDFSLRILFVETRGLSLFGYDLTNWSLYELIHADEIPTVRDAHINVLRDDESISGYYRILAKDGGWVWVKTKFMKIAGSPPNSSSLILGITTLISEMEERGTVIGIIQRAAATVK